ncbi:MAG: hypothetical protein FJ030_15535 [Chloroflexi bacterium]|nr:hypothetical protein [Chloroflexota bacterium]
MKRRLALTLTLIILALLACGRSTPTPDVGAESAIEPTPPTPSPTPRPTTAPAGEIAAVDLIGAWVNAGASESQPFEFVGTDGRTYAATFADDILPLFDRPNRWFDGGKECTNCHTSDLNDSDSELDLTSYDGIMTGSYRLSNPPGAAIIIPGNWQDSPLRRRLMFNRMPIGITQDVDRDGPEVRAGDGTALAVSLIGAWVNDGASATELFQFTGLDGNMYTTTYTDSIEPLLTKRSIWASNTKPCERCHVANVAESDAELDLTSLDGLLAGSWRVSQPPGVPIIIPGNWEASLLRERLRNNRMPMGITDDAPPEGPLMEAGHSK